MNDGYFFGFLSGLGVGLIIAMLLVVGLLSTQGNSFERECLLEGFVVLNETAFACERAE